MAAVSKITQLDMFIKDKKELDEHIKKEQAESLKKQVRHLYYQTSEHMRRLDKLEELMGALLDEFLSEEKNPLTENL